MNYLLKIIKILILNITIVYFQFLPNCTNAATSKINPLTNSSPPSLGNFSYAEMLIYTIDFAKRFGLNSSKAQSLSPGLLAAELIIKQPLATDIISGYFKYLCYVNLYLDSRLNIWYPVGPFGDNQAIVNLAESAKAPLKKFSIKDNNIINDGGRSGMPGIITSKMWLITKGSSKIPEDYTTVWYDAYHSNIMPGISYFTLEIHCDDIFHNGNGSMLWLEKNGGQDYRQAAGIFPYVKSEFNLIDLPYNFTNWDYLQQAIKDNNEEITDILAKWYPSVCGKHQC